MEGNKQYCVPVSFTFSTFAALTLMIISPLALGSAFQLPLQSVTNQGFSYAGTAAYAVDASTNILNPAGLTRLCDDQLVFGGFGSFVHSPLHVTNATTTFGNPVFPNFGKTRPISGAAIPFFHYAHPATEDLVFGLSIFTGFGQRMNYHSRSIARYTSTRAELITVDASPGFGYRLTDELSLGAGLDLLYARLRYNFKFGFGLTEFDGFSKLRADNDVAVGGHIGALYEFSPCTRLGLNYRSRINPKLKGHTQTQIPSNNAAIARVATHTRFNLPDIAVVSFYHDINEQWAGLADVQWTGWHKFKRVVLRNSDGTKTIINENYKNTYFLALGGRYQPNDCWQFKAGVSYDISPIPLRNRPIYLPDEDQTALSVGFQYRLSKYVAMDLAYTSVLFKRAKLQTSPPINIGNPPTFQTIAGNARMHIDCIGLQFTWDLN